ncbi:MAG: hypothetical protein ICV59_05050 [Thermoleophilia bacterium]|nr:hypothetical protein [Thermoleophilia bacterium]
MNAVAIDLDALGDTQSLWRAWLEDAARRFAAIAALDPVSLPRDRAAAAAQLDAWAARGVGDWHAALARFAEDHAALHLRRDPEVGAALRRLAGARIGVFTDAPEPLARVALAQLGATRHVGAVETGAGAFDRVRQRLGPHAAVVRTRAELLRLRD